MISRYCHCIVTPGHDPIMLSDKFFHRPSSSPPPPPSILPHLNPLFFFVESFQFFPSCAHFLLPVPLAVWALRLPAEYFPYPLAPFLPLQEGRWSRQKEITSFRLQCLHGIDCLPGPCTFFLYLFHNSLSETIYCALSPLFLFGPMLPLLGHTVICGLFVRRGVCASSLDFSRKPLQRRFFRDNKAP